MPRKPQSYNNTTPVQQFTETAYDAVVICAENIEEIIRSAGAADVMSLYLGAYDTEPTENNDGEPLVSGNFYLDTTTSSLKYWDAENLVWVESDVDTVVNAAQTALDARDAALASATAAATSEANAASSESVASTQAANATASAVDALNSQQVAQASEASAIAAQGAAESAQAAAELAETNASISETNASASESAAALSESNASASESAAAASAAAAEAAFDNFDDKYLGAKNSDPAYDNDGNALQVGATYWNIPEEEQRFWSGTEWDTPSEVATQAADRAVAAQTGAETAEYNAGLSENAAQASANAAGVDANNAGNSATAAATSESNAAASESAARASELAANASESNAGASESNAATSASNAADSASAAATSASEASTSETNAANSASIAGTARDTAIEARTGAETAETNAASSESAAATSESNAATSETNAGISETNAETSETNAAASESAAAASAAAALLSEQNAESSASLFEWQRYVRNQAALETLRKTNGDQFAAGGFVHYGQDYNSSAASINPINEGMWTNETDANVVYYGNDAALVDGGTSKTKYPVTHIAGYISEVLYLNTPTATRSYNRVKFPDAPDGTVTYNSVTNENITHVDAATAFAFADADDDVEVIIDRHDMFGGEFFLEEVSSTNPYVYPKGMIQSQATTMNGITTVRSNRPDTYYAVFTEDTGSAGLGVDFWAATTQQKVDMVSDESNNLFLLQDGRLVQWRMRQRTIAGVGNGDWLNVQPNIESTLRFDNQSQLSPQGVYDVAPSFVGGWSGGNGTYFTTNHSGNTKPQTGIFTGLKNGGTDAGLNGEIYFNVWGVVRRLNQGAYHPSFNPLGTRTWVQSGKGWDADWHSVTGVSGTAQCFNYLTSADDLTNAGANVEYSGFIGSRDGSGRADGRLYDAIYDGGDGGVNDHRLSAWDMSSAEEASKAFQKVVNGTYRGEEELVYTRNLLSTTVGATRTNSYVIVDVGDNSSSEYDWITSSSASAPTPAHGTLIINGVARKVVGASKSGSNFLTFNTHETFTSNAGETAVGAVGYFMGSTVSGEFQMVDVIGDPADILATPDLANGWQGGWAGIHDGSAVPLTRKCLDSSTNPIYTTNQGTSWTSTTWTVNTTTNVVNTGGSSPQVSVVPYTAFAKQTVEADSESVLNAHEGVGNVMTAANSALDWGVFLTESLMGKVLTADSSGSGGAFHPVTRLGIARTSGELAPWTSDPTEHEPIALPAPNNYSPAVKALWYQTANNEQVSLNFAWNELVWGDSTITSIDGTTTQIINGYAKHLVLGGNVGGSVILRDRSGSFSDSLENMIVADGKVYAGLTQFHDKVHSFVLVDAGNYWGDDSTISITGGTGTYTNLNGDTCLRGTATLSKPIGYTKNQARTGAQAEGVDL